LLWLYSKLDFLLTPLWRWALHKRLQRGKESVLSVRQKLNLGTTESIEFRNTAQSEVWKEAISNGRVVWGHAVGVGELMALRGVIEVLRQDLPDHCFVLTSISLTSGQAFAQQEQFANIIHQYAPADSRTYCQAFVERWNPRLAIFCELDLWPAMINSSTSAKIPTVLIEARTTRAKAVKKRWLSSLYASVLEKFEFIYCRDFETKIALETLGVSSSRLEVSGTVKALAVPLSADQHQWSLMAQAMQGRPCWLAASTYAGEEAFLLEAHRSVLECFPDTLLIIAPRDVPRGLEIVELTHQLGFSAALRKDLVTITEKVTAIPPRNSQVFVANTMGELGIWYRFGQVCFMGRSIGLTEAARGGKNPFEALAFKTKLVSGPYVENFRDSYELLWASGQAKRIETAAELANLVVAELTHRSSDQSLATEPNPSKAIDPALRAMLNKLVKLATLKQEKGRRDDR
jgi:3-deoxy-D-manno-octulosonic-acid transferase